MIVNQVLSLAATLAASFAINGVSKATVHAPTTIYDFSMKTIDGKVVPLSKFKGKVLLVVNVASKCGNTPQYAGLETMYSQDKHKGFAILGFPCNQFGGQEPGTDARN